MQVGPQATANDGILAGASGRSPTAASAKSPWAQGGYNRNARVCLFNAHQKIDQPPVRTRGARTTSIGTCGSATNGDCAPKIPWNPEHFFRFRKYWPYNGGVATDLLVSQARAVALGDRRAGRRVSLAGQRERRPLHRKGRPRHPRHVLDDGRLPERVFDLPGQHADERLGNSRPHLRQVRHDGSRRRARAAVQR